MDYYGAPTPINQMASIQVVEGTQLVIKPYDRSIIKNIAAAIQAANLGLNPQAEGDIIRIQVPSLTEDRRKELAKEAHKYGEEAKVAIRNIRRDANDAIKKDKELREDEEKAALEDSQKLTDKFSKKIDEIIENKTSRYIKRIKPNTLWVFLEMRDRYDTQNGCHYYGWKWTMGQSARFTTNCRS